MQREPSVRGTGGRGLLCLAQSLLSAPWLLAQVTLLRMGGRAQHWQGESRACSASVLCQGLHGCHISSKVPELEIISTLSSLRPTWPKCETLSPHRIANLDTEFYRCTDTRKEHCRTTVTRQKRLTSKCAMKGKLFLKDMTFYLQRIKHNSTTQESTIYCWLNY